MLGIRGSAGIPALQSGLRCRAPVLLRSRRLHELQEIRSPPHIRASAGASRAAGSNKYRDFLYRHVGRACLAAPWKLQHTLLRPVPHTRPDLLIFAISVHKHFLTQYAGFLAGIVGIMSIYYGITACNPGLKKEQLIMLFLYLTLGGTALLTFPVTVFIDRMVVVPVPTT